jgi:hypothetical protein
MKVILGLLIKIHGPDNTVYKPSPKNERKAIFSKGWKNIASWPAQNTHI